MVNFYIFVPTLFPHVPPGSTMHKLFVEPCSFNSWSTSFFFRLGPINQEISRRDLRKAIERRCCSAIGESELLVLCDSLDPDRRGRVRLSEVEALLRRNGRDRGTAARGVRHKSEWLC